MSDSEDIQSALVDNLAAGVAEKQIADRRYRYHSPKDVYEIAKKIASDEQAAQSGPFLKVKMTGPTV